MSKRRASQLLRDALRALDAGQPARAIEACNAALELNPLDADAFALRGGAHEERKKLDEAIADYSSALQLRPGTGEVHYNRGFARLKKGETAGALRDFTAALKSKTLRDDPDLLLARARCQLELGKTTPARKDATRLVVVLEKEHVRLAREHAGLPARAARSFFAPLLGRLAEAKRLLTTIERAR